MLRKTVILALLCFAALQPLSADDFKFKVTQSKDFELELEIFGGPLMLIDSCWSNAKADLDWIVVCDFGDPVGVAVAAISDSDEEKCEDFQLGVFGGSEGLVCLATLFTTGKTGKGNGSFRFTGTERSARSTAVAVPIAPGELPEFRSVIDDFKQATRRIKRDN